MANANWISNAQSRPDVWWATPGVVDATSWFALTINHKTIKVYAGDKDSGGTATTIDAAGVVSLLKDAIEASPDPEWKELTVTMGLLYPDGSRIEVVDSLGTTLILTGPDDGKPVTITCSDGTRATPEIVVTVLTQGLAGQNEKQSISFGTTATGGTFTLSFAGQTTGNIAYNANAATVETAFEALSSVGSGNGTVSGTAGAWVVEFTGTLAQTNVPLITGDGALLTGAGQVDITTTTQGTGFLVTNEEQSYNISGLSSSSIYRIGLYGTGTAGIEYTGGFYLTPPSVWSYATSTVSVHIQQTATQILLDYYGVSGGVNMGAACLEVYQPYNGTWVNVGTFTTDVEGGSGAVNEVQRIAVYKATGGHFHLIFQGETTGAITYSAVPATLAANIDTALEALTGIGAGNVAVAVSSSTSVADVFTATFGGTLAGIDVEQMTSDATSLTGGTVVVSVTQAAIVNVNESQMITLPDGIASGTFTLSFGGETTTALTYDESASDIDAALEALTTIDSVTVNGDAGGPWVVTFYGTQAATNVGPITASGYGLVFSGTQTIEVNRQVVRRYTGGTWVQSTRVFTSGTNPTNDGVAVGDAACVYPDGTVGQTAYMARVTARDTTTITLSADAIEGTPPANGTTDTTLLIVTAPTGPNYYDNVDNWELGALPADSDTINAEDGSRDILYNVNQSLITVAAINVKASFTGAVSLGRTDDNDYWQYRTQYLTLGNATDAVTTTITVGQGDGNGSGQLWLNSGAGQVAVKVYKTAPPGETGLPAFIWKGTHASNTMEILNGSVGVAMFAGETAAIATLSIGYTDNQRTDAAVIIGSGCGTITTINKFGGDLTLHTSVTTFTQAGGNTLHVAGTVGTLNLYGGTYVHRNAGNITTLNIYNDAEADFSSGDAAVTVTNCTVYGSKAPIDPYKRVTFTNPVAFKGPSTVTLDWGTNYSLQRS